MKLLINNTDYIETDEPIDLSIPLTNSEENPKAWYVKTPIFEPVRTEHYTGSVAEGGSVNFRNIFFQSPRSWNSYRVFRSHYRRGIFNK
jgi:hypothetical protein